MDFDNKFSIDRDAFTCGYIHFLYKHILSKTNGAVSRAWKENTRCSATLVSWHRTGIHRNISRWEMVPTVWISVHFNREWNFGPNIWMPLGWLFYRVGTIAYSGRLYLYDVWNFRTLSTVFFSWSHRGKLACQEEREKLEKLVRPGLTGDERLEVRLTSKTNISTSND